MAQRYQPSEQVKKWMKIYQTVAGVMMEEIPDEDNELSERAQSELVIANASAVHVMNALANIIELCDNPNATEKDML